MKVFKFGGASVKNANAVKNVAQILSGYKDNLVVVISAMGKTTNLMETLVKAYFNNEDFTTEIFTQFKVFHTEICDELFNGEGIPKSINLLFSELENLKREDVTLYINHIKPSYLEIITREIEQFKGKYNPIILKDLDIINF